MLLTKSIDMLNKNTLGVKKRRGQVGSTSHVLYMRLKGVISGRGQGLLTFNTPSGGTFAVICT